MAELALGDDVRHAIVRHLHGLPVAELMGHEASANARACGCAAQLGTRGQPAG